jgi:phosphoribosylamine-glycine ligase
MVLTSIASSIAKSKNLVYQEVSEISYDGIFYRKDICGKI